MKLILRIVLAIDLALLKMEQFMSWLQCGYHIVIFSSSGSYYIFKTSWEYLSDTESVTLLS